MAKRDKYQSFEDALGALKKQHKRPSPDRFVETGEGLKIERKEAADAPAAAGAAGAAAGAKPKRVSIADLLLDEIEKEGFDLDMVDDA